jgi:hypothetical protein
MQKMVMSITKDYDSWEYNNEDGTIDIILKGEVIDRLYIDSYVDLWAAGEL